MFNRGWIKEHLPENFWQRYKAVLKWAIPVTAASMIVAGVMVGLTQEAQKQKLIADNHAMEAEAQREIALDQQSIAELNENKALRQERRALLGEKKVKKALDAEKKAKRQTTKALKDAVIQKRLAKKTSQHCSNRATTC